MTRKRIINPFSPNRPVDDPLRFSGREHQVDEIIDSLYQIANNNPKHSIITGDRGIGKSSLLLQTKLLATGDNRLAKKLNIELGVKKFDFIVAWHDADKDQNVEHVVTGLLRELQNIIQNVFGKLSFELDLGGILKIVQSEQKDKSIADLANEFCIQIGKACKEVTKKDKNGIILFIDEIDRIPPKSGLATFIKLTTEKLNRDGFKNVGFICAGITGSIQNLEEDHASILRTFRDIPIPRLSLEESTLILQAGFNAVNFKFNDRVFDLAYEITAGFPEPVHLLGSEMLSVTSDDFIDEHDFEMAKHRLITDIRKNELSSLLKKAGYGKYQQILRAMAEYINPNVPLDFISEKIHLKQNEYSTNINNLIQREVISRVDKGIYCFVNPLLKEYIKNFGIIDLGTKDGVELIDEDADTLTPN